MDREQWREVSTLRQARTQFAFLLAVLVAVQVLRLPLVASFQWYAFGDEGSVLRVDQLVAMGMRPHDDFIYNYGLLGLLLGRGWFWAWGRSPGALMALMFACQVTLVWGLVRFLGAVGGRRGETFLVAASIPYLVASANTTLTHALEPALLVHALADHVQGRLRRALALATIAALVKPTVGIVYCGVLLLQLVGNRAREVGGGKRILSELAPAASTLVAISVALAAAFGPGAVFDSLVPIHGLRTYRSADFGFFSGAGRLFWSPRGHNLLYYVGTPAGFWLVTSSIAMGATVLGLLALARRRASAWLDARAGFLACCGACYAAWLLLFFGGPWHWPYYFSFAVLACVVLISSLWGRGKLRRVVLLPMVVLALTGTRTELEAALDAWRSYERTADTHGLWCAPDVLREWEGVLQALKGRRATGALLIGGLAQLDSRFTSPRYWIFWVSDDHPRMSAELARSLRTSDRVMLEKFWQHTYELGWSAPEVRAELAAFAPVWDGRYFRVLERVPQVPRSEGQRAQP